MIDSIGKVVAANLKRERTARQLSLSELSRMAGVNKATLSQVEAGRGNPTIDTLFSLATALQVPLSTLVEEGPEPEFQIIGPTDGTYVEVGIGQVRLIRRIVGHSIVELYELDLKPNTYTESQPHATGTVEHFLITEGDLTTGARDRPVQLRAGDYGAFHADHPHLYKTSNDGVRGYLMIGYGNDVSALLSDTKHQETRDDNPKTH